jgi:hypothetical protein
LAKTKNKGKASQKKKGATPVVVKEGMGIGVPVSSSPSNVPSPNSNYQTVSTTSPNTTGMYWPAPTAWYQMGKDATKKALLEYVNGAVQVQNETDEKRRLDLTSKMNMAIQTIIQGIAIATEAAELQTQRKRTGDQSAVFELSLTEDTLRRMLKMLWLHDVVAKKGTYPGLEIKLLDSQLTGRINRTTVITTNDDGLPVELDKGEDPNLIWMTDYTPPAPGMQGMPAPTDPGASAVPPEAQPLAEPPPATAAPAPEAPPSAPVQAPPPEQGGVQPPAEVPLQEEQAAAEGTSPEGQELPYEDMVNQLQPPPPPPPPPEQEATVTPPATTEPPEAEPMTDGTLGAANAPETDISQREAAITQREAAVAQREAAVAQREAALSSGGAPPEEPVEEEMGEEEQSQEGEEEPPAEGEEELVEGEEEPPAEGEEPPAEDEGEEEAETFYCEECDAEVTQEDIDACTNENCPLKSATATQEEGNSEENIDTGEEGDEEDEEEPPPGEIGKTMAILDSGSHAGHNVHKISFQEHNGVEGQFCLDCKVLTKCYFDASWTEGQIEKWTEKHFKKKSMVQKTPQDMIESALDFIPDEEILKWISEAKGITEEVDMDNALNSDDFFNCMEEAVSKGFDGVKEKFNGLR